MQKNSSMKSKYKFYRLHFIHPGGTSRGVLHYKDTYIIDIWNSEKPEWQGRGEAALFRGLSADDVPNYEEKLAEVCENIDDYIQNYRQSLQQFPSIQFGLETALADLENRTKHILFPSEFTEGKKGIRINGLIWMGNPEYMRNQIDNKLNKGFNCLKMKIGAIDFETELVILKSIRNRYSADTLELRVDANGGFAPDEALTKLARLSEIKLHSIEQPIKAGQWSKMAELCRKTPLPIALDEELIGVFELSKKQELLEAIKPQYIILKPALVGGFSGAEEWIKLASKSAIDWWVTSALESNIGLNAIAQWTFKLQNPLPQGLGTGQVFSNNFPSPLNLASDMLRFDVHTELVSC